MSQDANLQPLVAGAYMGLADVLSELAGDDWDAPSLCEGWRIREVIAHLTMPARYDQEAFMQELEARQFDFAKLSNEIAARDGQASTDGLLADLRSEQLHHWAPPGGGYHGALNHVVIHGLDVTEPLGVSTRTPDQTLRIVLTDLTEGEMHRHFGTEIAGKRLEATNLDWSFGSGPVLRGAAGDLALVLCGREIPDGRLEGALA